MSGLGGCGDIEEAEPLLIDHPLDYQGDFGPPAVDLPEPPDAPEMHAPEGESRE